MGTSRPRKTYFDRASERVGDVKDDGSRQELLAWLERLTAELQKWTAAPAPPGTSPPSSGAPSSAVDPTGATATTSLAPPVATEPALPESPVFQLPPEFQSLIASFPQSNPAPTTPDPQILLGPAPTTTPGEQTDPNWAGRRGTGAGTDHAAAGPSSRHRHRTRPLRRRLRRPRRKLHQVRRRLGENLRRAFALVGSRFGPFASRRSRRRAAPRSATRRRSRGSSPR